MHLYEAYDKSLSKAKARHTCSNQLGYLKSIYDKLLNFKNYIIGVYSAVLINMIKKNPRWLGKKRCLLQA
jgi:hypothetical protein